MWRLKLTTAAKQDIRAIARYIAQSSGSAATGRQFALRLKATCERIARRAPMMGRARPELADGLRSVPDGNYLIFIRYTGDILEVVNIIEGHRDVEAMYGTAGDPDDGT